ncbi:MAG: YbaK/EbsC family protein [Kangiellaceae bacterium]|nr:YbaK/EbsC family protein [Kangiellaceae bacterium]MCW9000476.1 YbaK/EbsC family protein [Kangiellaceae bacterium]
MTELKASAKKVQDFLDSKGFDFVVKQLPSSTRTAQEAADSIGCSVPQIAKSLIFKDKLNEQPVLIVASGSNRVCEKTVKQETGIRLSKADADFVREKVGFAIGGVPPVAHNDSVIILLDPDLKQYEVIWAAAGTPNSVFELKPDDLTTLTDGRWVKVTK